MSLARSLYKSSLWCFLFVCCFFVADAAEDPVCDATVCSNGGTCSLDESGTPACACPFGYDGQNCENTWFSREVWTSLQSEVKTLNLTTKFGQRLQIFQDRQISALRKDLDNLKSLISELNGPRFFSPWSTLELSGVRDLSYLQIGERQFVVALNFTTGVLVYEIVESSFILLQTIPCVNCLGLKAFSLEDDHHCIAVAGGSSTLFCWNEVSQTLEKAQDISTREAVSVEYLTVEKRHFLVFACNGSDSGTPTFVYVWLSGRFLLYQYLPTVGAIQANSESTSSGSFLVVSQSASPLATKVFKWNGTYFEVLQSFESNIAYLFSMGEHIFIALSSAIHRYVPAMDSFIQHSTLQGLADGVVGSYKYFDISSEHYLVVSIQQSPSNSSPRALTVNRLNGMDFLSYDTLPSPAGEDKGILYGFEDAKGRHVLAVANVGKGVTFYRWVSHLFAA